MGATCLHGKSRTEGRWLRNFQVISQPEEPAVISRTGSLRKRLQAERTQKGRLFPLPSSSIALKPPNHQFSSRLDSWAAQRRRYPRGIPLKALVIHESFGQAASLPCSALGKGTGRMLPPACIPHAAALHASHGDLGLWSSPIRPQTPSCSTLSHCQLFKSLSSSLLTAA